MRSDNRLNDELRKITIKSGFVIYPEGSILISFGNTKVLCNVSILENKQPPHLKGSNKGWLTAEYSLLPRSTKSRVNREVVSGKIKGRTHEIQRLIGRVLRAVIDLNKLGPHTIWIDCDVLQADGGTRTAAINGAFIALVLAIEKFKKTKNITNNLITNYLAAISVGIINNEILLDLNYREDNKAQVDMNIAVDGNNNYIEIQATGEESSFNGEQLDQMLEYSLIGCDEIIKYEKDFFKENNIDKLP